jgi:flagellar biosynthesis/type III secretory pathway M-ring protein FliF/YscJ
MGPVRQIQEVLGAGPIAGIFALMAIAIVVLFVQLMRAHKAQLAQAAQLLPLAEQMLAGLATLEAQTDDLKAVVQSLRQRRRPSNTSETETVSMRVPALVREPPKGGSPP